MGDTDLESTLNRNGWPTTGEALQAEIERRRDEAIMSWGEANTALASGRAAREKAEKANAGLLDAVERLNETLDRLERENADLRQIAALDPDALMAAEADRDRLREALDFARELLKVSGVDHPNIDGAIAALSQSSRDRQEGEG